MRVSPQARALLLVADIVALGGVIAFSVLAALDSDKVGYIVVQIVCAVVILISVVLLNQNVSPSEDA